MYWQGKAALMQVFSVSPWGNKLHYLAQTRVTRSLPSPDEKFAEGFDRATKHVEAVTRCWHGGVDRAQFYEFGAGWDLAIPLSLYVYGVRTQVLVDIRRLVRIELVNETIRKLQRIAREGKAIRIPEPFLEHSEHDRSADLLRNVYGLEYLAPCDARMTGLKSGSIDVITSTNTLEHIPAADIKLILKECRRLLRADGLMSFIVDYQDHYSYCDSRITAYNFLKYSDSKWRLYNPAFHYQNRLRHKDYLTLFREAGFHVIEEQVIPPSADDLAHLRQASISRRFIENYSIPELGVRSAQIVLRVTA
jgi:predicted SAM-dependent methyltransferase